MDIVLDFADQYLLDAVYAKFVPAVNASIFASPRSQWSSKILSLLPTPAPELLDTVAPASAWPRSYLPRQILSLSVLTLLGIHLLYFLIAGLAYEFVFNHEMRKHPRFLKDQERLEIASSLRAFPAIMVLTVPWFLAEVRGHSRLYDGVDTYGYAYLFFSAPLFLLFTDYCIYWIHRWLHIPAVYKRLHKPHHKWIIPTPWASHAFHPLDGYLQGVPYHLFVFILPLHRVLYLALFVFVNVWTIFIHDSDMIVGHPLEKVINGPAHHTLHHIYFTCNYGQYFTWADRAGNSYRQPESHLDPLLEVHALENTKVE
ncbi:Fatty acid hydroxylase [Mycena kentingensis (nom. inval.)]|nr:Fatty acid hydroxylase [Mycena kentingensis (nom. inval.)]